LVKGSMIGLKLGLGVVLPGHGDHVFGQRADQVRRVDRDVAPEEQPLVVGLERRMNLLEEVEIDRAQPLLLHLLARLAQAQFKGFVGADVRVGAGKDLGQLAEPTGDQRQRGGIAGRQHRAVRRLAQPENCSNLSTWCRWPKDSCSGMTVMWYWAA
jgi:hypothetical protein